MRVYRLRGRRFRSVAAAIVVLVLALIGVTVWRLTAPGSRAEIASQPAEVAAQPTDYHVPGENYQVCNEKPKYLTSPWTYDALASGSRSYTVAQYEALQGDGKKLPPLPSYISRQPSTTEAAVIFAPGSTQISAPPYTFPESPILYFFEGGSYGELNLQSVSGDEFIGGAAAGHPEPAFNDGGDAGGINNADDSYNYSGGAGALSASAKVGATKVGTITAIPGYIDYITFSDGSTYRISAHSGTSITLGSPLTSAEASGRPVWANASAPIAEVSAAAAHGTTKVRLTGSSIPLVTGGEVVIGDDPYQLTSVSGSQSGYTAGMAGLDVPVAAHTPVYYDTPAGGVRVEYLDISNDLHTTTGTISMGVGWTIEHNDIHDSYGKPGEGVAFYSGDGGTVEYNCFARLGDYAGGGAGTGGKFEYNEVLETAYKPDPGCGCSGGGKWWGTLNADINDNAFVEDGLGGQPAIWLDNGNTGTLIEGNYFYRDAGSAIINETGYNMRVDDNLFLDNGWGSGQSQDTNNDGAININSSGGFNIPGSRYENSISITGNYFVNNWQGIDIWQSGLRSCESSGEGWPVDASYCSGGFPNTDTTAANGAYYFSHIGDSKHGGATTLAQSVSAGSSTILVNGAEAIDDQVGFSDPVSTTTADTANVSGFTGSGTLSVSRTTGFPVSGQLRVGTSAGWIDGGGSYTGAILSYTGRTATSFTGVSFVRGSGTLSGPVLQVQPYKVTAETCYANDCALSVSPSISSSEQAGAEVSNAGTCQLYATSAAMPSGPIAPDGVSYWDGCQWEVHDVSVTGNQFVFQPSFIAASAPPQGTATSTVCTASHTGSCGTNFMAYQNSSGAPFGNQTGANAMMSSSSFTGCPSWDSGCATNPLANINALSDPPGSTANNGEKPGDNIWSRNTYVGPWAWYAYLFGACSPLPTDPKTGRSMPSSACGLMDFSDWHSDWHQDAFSTFASAAGSTG
jgi:hypothetical protein